MFALSENVGITFSSNSAWWSWALCWILNRVSSTRAVTPYEPVYGREYTGALCEFGEPIFWIPQKQAAKFSARWKRAIFLGKIDPQDSYLLYDGQKLVLTRSVRRNLNILEGNTLLSMSISLAGVGITSLVLVEEWFQQRNNDQLWEPVSASQKAISSHLLSLMRRQKQVRQKFLEEQKEEEEAGEMALHDKPAVANLEVEQKPAAVTFGETIVVEDDQPRTPPADMQEERRSFFDVRPAAAPSNSCGIFFNADEWFGCSYNSTNSPNNESTWS